MATPSSSVTKASEDLLNSANDPWSNDLMRYSGLQTSSTSTQAMNYTFKTDNEVSGFCSEKFKWISPQEDDHDRCKCIKDNINIIVKRKNFHFCGFDDNKICTSSTKIDTYISDSSKKRKSEGGTTKKRLKVSMNLWEPAKLEICLQDVYCSDVMIKYVAPKDRFEPGTVVWTKMAGYPKWPAMIDNDPDHNTYWCIIKKKPQMVQYHVVFFDEENLVSRYWSPEDRIQPFSCRPCINFNSLAIYKRFQAGLQQANKAVKMSIQDRIDTYGFAAKMRRPNVILVED